MTKIIDVNASFGFWPTQKFPYRNLEDLNAAYERNQIDEVWLSAVESILFPDPDEFDLPLFEEMQNFPRFKPVKTVNPLLANWKASLEESIRDFPLAAIKIYPNYHDYPINLGELKKLAQVAGDNNLPLLVSMRVNDERNQPTALQVRGVTPGNICSLANSCPQTSIIALCAYISEIAALHTAPNIKTDISFLDYEDTLVYAANVGDVSKLVFGTHSAFLYPEAAAYKLRYSLISDEAKAVIAGNI